ncbi:ras-like GTP-binding protein RhoL [Anopheles ziemanni]|uniref:ras-like GTP-binding protein RhoL n=1 Tax=Anopheles coustani TaxID=139045 RepID=UPI002658C971|nr:ras-like GTP-binding protein RhoL [Anopheles coustani]XP_058116556.1 ras-like GTP-binding protein RhoL [Anopheles coustani]XP_058116567.1 ras-like GTP-binding protein RhoL [Anopheles coustani]XP_058169348.1 ras-like GTP-binding protein RhoL [Anopheles ziemanni]XP_058169349.1 ras-like GTP-binding protein RhoL [Anopheles ziemanni]XP_058169351.1 ras-like GTP-binding protein RhoL [Anopheles ziemanni]
MVVVGPFKVVTVGDGMVGKTYMLITYARNEFPIECLPTVFDNHACNIVIDGSDYSLTLWDTPGREDCERLRPLSYSNTDCFLICYSISSRTSYDNILSKWWPEVRTHLPEAAIVLVGTKSDLRVPGSEKFVTTAEGKKMKHKIKAYALVECSAKRKENLHEVFKKAVRAAEKRPYMGHRSCTIL